MPTKELCPCRGSVHQLNNHSQSTAKHQLTLLTPFAGHEEEDTLSECELQQLYGGGGGGGGGGASQASKEEGECLATMRAVSRPVGAVRNMFAVTSSSQSKQCVRSRYGLM